MEAQLKINESGSFRWNTEYYHNDNVFTMQDFLENHLPIEFLVINDDGSYVEVQNQVTDAIFSLDAKGDGDCYNHIVEWNFLR